MGRPRKPPAFLVEANVYRSSKLADLPNDSARLGFFFAVLGMAKLATVQGTFASRATFRAQAGKFDRFLGDYLAAGILEAVPDLCPRCKPRWVGLAEGTLIVHDWHEHQYDPRRLERQREYDARPVPAPVSGPVSSPQSSPIPDDSLAYGGAGTGGSNIEHRTSNVSPSGEDPTREDVAALLARGWAKVSLRQLAVLNEILERHDSSGAAWAAAIIRTAPPDADPLEAVLVADREWQAERRQAVMAEEVEWRATKEADRREAAQVLERLGVQP